MKLIVSSKQTTKVRQFARLFSALKFYSISSKLTQMVSRFFNTVKYGLGELLLEDFTLSEYNKENYADVIFPVLPDNNALDDSIELFHLPVNLGSADADSTGV